MQTLLRILERAGGYRPALYLKIENPSYMALVIEATPEPGPCGLPSISVAHYGEQNGDLMRDPEMCFELSKPPLCGLRLSSFYFLCCAQHNEYCVKRRIMLSEQEECSRDAGNLHLDCT